MGSYSFSASLQTHDPELLLVDGLLHSFTRARDVFLCARVSLRAREVERVMFDFSLLLTCAHTYLDMAPFFLRLPSPTRRSSSGVDAVAGEDMTSCSVSTPLMTRDCPLMVSKNPLLMATT